MSASITLELRSLSRRGRLPSAVWNAAATRTAKLKTKQKKRAVVFFPTSRHSFVNSVRYLFITSATRGPDAGAWRTPIDEIPQGPPRFTSIVPDALFGKLHVYFCFFLRDGKTLGNADRLSVEALSSGHQCTVPTDCRVLQTARLESRGFFSAFPRSLAFFLLFRRTLPCRRTISSRFPPLLHLGSPHQYLPAHESGQRQRSPRRTRPGLRCCTESAGSVGCGTVY